MMTVSVATFVVTTLWRNRDVYIVVVVLYLPTDQDSLQPLTVSVSLQTSSD